MHLVHVVLTSHAERPVLAEVLALQEEDREGTPVDEVNGLVGFSMQLRDVDRRVAEERGSWIPYVRVRSSVNQIQDNGVSVIGISDPWGYTLDCV